VPKRPVLVLGIVAFGAALSFLLGLFSGVPEDVSEAWFAFLSLAFVVAVTATAVHMALGRRRESEDIETLLALFGVLLGALFAAVFTEAFAVGASVAAHQGWGDKESFFINPEEAWQARLLNFRENAPAAGALFGILPGFVGWGSRMTGLWSEPPTRFPPS